MGLGKWWMTYGPGSPGSVARAMAKCYVRCKRLNPRASQSELLRATLKGRYEVGGPFAPIDDQEVEYLVGLSEGKLSGLTVYVWVRENPHVQGAMENAPHVFAEGIQIIRQETQKISPEAT